MMNISYIYNKVKDSVSWSFLCLLTMAVFFASCSEEDDSTEEFVNWQSVNVTYGNNLYNEAKAKQEGGDNSWKVIPMYSYANASSVPAEKCIVVHINENGTGDGCPLQKDTVRVHYRGHLLPSTTYTDGFQFDSSWVGDFNPETALPAKMAVSAVIDGWQTALQQMHIGDDWDVYVPYQLGYGTTQNSKSSIPAYSTLIFRIVLVDYWHPGETHPAYKTKAGQSK